jgi:dephospho-CoA kinase
VRSLYLRWLLTGGIGSGKSEVRRLLEQHGIRTVDADSVGHSILEHEAFEAVSKTWPVVVVDGVIDRSSLARVVFAEPEELRALEAITHPLIFDRIETELEGFDGVVVVEMPLIDTDMGWPRIVVDSLEEVRIRRAVGRGMDPDDVQRRLAAQPSRAMWLGSADLVVPNHGNLRDLEQTTATLARYLTG